MGSGDIWIGWIKECLSSARIAALVNGSPTNEIQMERGLRQGDPLSPLLFIIGAKGLNAIITNANQLGFFKRVEVGKEKILVTHLHYAEDTLLVGAASDEEVQAMKYIMHMFELISGLKINLSKSSLIGINVNEEWLYMMAETLGCKKRFSSLYIPGAPGWSKS